MYTYIDNCKYHHVSICIGFYEEVLTKTSTSTLTLWEETNCQYFIASPLGDWPNHWIFPPIIVLKVGHFFKKSNHSTAIKINISNYLNVYLFPESYFLSHSKGPQPGNQARGETEPLERFPNPIPAYQKTPWICRGDGTGEGDRTGRIRGAGRHLALPLGSLF